MFLLVTIWDRLNGCLDILGYGALNRIFNVIFFVYKNNTNELLVGVTNLKLMLMFKGM